MSTLYGFVNLISSSPYPQISVVISHFQLNSIRSTPALQTQNEKYPFQFKQSANRRISNIYESHSCFACYRLLMLLLFAIFAFALSFDNVAVLHLLWFNVLFFPPLFRLTFAIHTLIQQRGYSRVRSSIVLATFQHTVVKLEIAVSHTMIRRMKPVEQMNEFQRNIWLNVIAYENQIT